MAHQDRDLLMRANRLGSPLVHLHYAGARAIVNSGREKQAFLGVNQSFEEMNQINRKKSAENLVAGRFTVNEARIPVRLRLNFSQDVEA
ncbi:MAG: hypothetical protein M3463_11885 [Verrucomicrobiota bacterium]|nr:hypothetical protein [Verrucomicrobiota bacterium]